MHLIKKIEQRSIARNAVILLAAITLSIAVATDGLAGGRGGRGGGGLRGGHIRGGFRGPLLNSVPSMPPPIFNPFESLHCPSLARDPRLAGKPRVSIPLKRPRLAGFSKEQIKKEIDLKL